jgi:hypothetical protein
MVPGTKGMRLDHRSVTCSAGKCGAVFVANARPKAVRDGHLAKSVHRLRTGTQSNSAHSLPYGARPQL